MWIFADMRPLREKKYRNEESGQAVIIRQKQEKNRTLTGKFVSCFLRPENFVRFVRFGNGNLW
jgi:hypothetical protein